MVSNRIPFHSRSTAYEIAEMLRELAVIFKVPAFAMVRRQCTCSAYVYFEFDSPVAADVAHWFAWGLGVRGWDIFESGTRGKRQWFALEEQPPADDAPTGN